MGQAIKLTLYLKNHRKPLAFNSRLAGYFLFLVPYDESLIRRH
jgi:hypothetical protein